MGVRGGGGRGWTADTVIDRIRPTGKPGFHPLGKTGSDHQEKKIVSDLYLWIWRLLGRTVFFIGNQKCDKAIVDPVPVSNRIQIRPCRKKPDPDPSLFQNWLRPKYPVDGHEPDYQYGGLVCLNENSNDRKARHRKINIDRSICRNSIAVRNRETRCREEGKASPRIREDGAEGVRREEGAEGVHRELQIKEEHGAHVMKIELHWNGEKYWQHQPAVVYENARRVVAHLLSPPAPGSGSGWSLRGRLRWTQGYLLCIFILVTPTPPLRFIFRV